MVQDAAELEQMLRQHVTPPDLLRAAHPAFRAFRALLFAPTNDAMPPAGAAAAVPAVTALSHCFSRLPRDVAAPHERPGVSAKQFSQWMDQRGEEEVMQAVGDALRGARVGSGEAGSLVARMQAAARA